MSCSIKFTLIGLSQEQLFAMEAMYLPDNWRKVMIMFRDNRLALKKLSEIPHKKDCKEPEGGNSFFPPLAQISVSYCMKEFCRWNF